MGLFCLLYKDHVRCFFFSENLCANIKYMDAHAIYFIFIWYFEIYSFMHFS
jgi:hypothetical protein